MVERDMGPFAHGGGDGAGLTRREVLKGAVTGAAAILGGGLAQSSLAFAAGTTVNIECDEGQNENPFLWFAGAMHKRFGINIKMEGLPFVGQYGKLVAELLSRSSVYDLMVFPPMFMGDFVAKGFLKPLDSYFHLLDPQLNDVLPAYRDPILRRNGRWFALPYDGDILMVTYRKDLFSDPKEQAAFKAKYNRPLAPPTTWEEFLDIARFFNRPPHLYGTAFYGQRGFCYAWFVNIFAAYGGRWFDASNMKATINSPAGLKALNMLLELKKYSPPNILQIGYPQLNQVFLNGNTAMVVQWDDLPLKVDDPSMSKVVGKAGFAPCPVRNYMPYSRVMAVSAYASDPVAAYKVAAFMTLNGKYYVYDPACGEDPYRYSQLNPALVKTHTGKPSMPHADAVAYVNALKGCLSTGYPELSITGAPTYLDVLDQFVNEALAGTLTAKEALNEAAARWDALTKELGAAHQLRSYQDWIRQFHAAGVKY